MNFKKAIIFLLASTCTVQSYAAIEIDQITASYISDRLNDMHNSNEDYYYPDNEIADDDININATIDWSSDKNLIIRTKKNINFSEYGNIIVKGDGSLFLQAGLEPGEKDEYISQVIFKKDTPQIIFSKDSADNSVNIYSNPLTLDDKHKYHNPQNFTYNVKPEYKMNNYFFVNDIYDLQAIAGQLYASYALSQNIDASATKTWKDEESNNDTKGFHPIGGLENKRAFSGSFDGGGYTINNLYINRPDDDNVALFGNVTGLNLHKSSIKNVNIYNSTIKGRKCVGSLVGQGIGIDYRNINVGNNSITSDNNTILGSVAGCIFFNTHSNISSTDQKLEPIGSCEECTSE
ncbi:hypothetical protein [Cysteiniphilum sp. 6C5]|uniref:hypothetical protein n=1 Tax=unclassified Cysteiniphilum TaxID=2610889 RepID=UPI003F85E252